MTLTVVRQVRYRGVDVTQDDILVSVAVISAGCDKHKTDFCVCVCVKCRQFNVQCSAVGNQASYKLYNQLRHIGSPFVVDDDAVVSRHWLNSLCD